MRLLLVLTTLIYLCITNESNKNNIMVMELANVTFHQTSTSLMNITLNSNINNQLITNQPLDLFISFTINSKYFTTKINMNNTLNNAITPKLYSLPISNHSFTNLLPLNFNNFNNIFPLQFIIENHPNNNHILFKYKSYNTDYIQQYQFNKPFPLNTPLHITKITTNTQPSTSILNTQLTVKYNVIMAQYLLTIRNINIYNQYQYKHTIQNKIHLAIHQYFKQTPSYIIIINNIKYNTHKHDTDITFQIHKQNNNENISNIQSIYTSYTDPTFYYLLSLHLNLIWNNNQDANYILNQFKTGNEINIKRNYISIFLIDFPSYTYTPNVSKTPTMTVSNTVETATHISTSLSSKTLMDYNNNYILAKTNNNNSTHIMTWTTFIIIILVLLLFILGIGCFIFYLNIQIQRLQTIAQNNNSKSRVNNIMPIPQSPSIPSMNNNINNNNNNIEGIGKEKPPNIEVGLQSINENIAQPPSAKLVKIKKKKRGSHFGHQQSMEFDVHLSNVVVGDAIVMDDIIDDMDNDENDDDDDLVMKSDVETPFSPESALTPGNYENNLDIGPQSVPDDTENDTGDDTGDDGVDEIENNNNDDDEYFGDLTPGGFDVQKSDK